MFLWIGQLFSQLADRVFIYLLVIVAYNITQKNIGVSVPMLAFGIPSVLFGSLAGVLVDWWSRKNILFISNILRGSLILLMLLPFMQSSLLLIFIVSFLIYTVSQVFAPAEASAIPDIVNKRDLIVANSLFMGTWMFSAVIGFGIGAPLAAFFGESNTFIIAALLYFISAIFVFFVPLVHRERYEKPSFNVVFKDFLAGFEFIRRNVIISFSLLKLFIVTSALAIVSVLSISFAQEYLGLEAVNFGYLVVFAGLGMILGISLLGLIHMILSKGSISIFGFILLGLMLICLAYTRNMQLAFTFAFFLGFGNAMITATIQTILQENIPRQMRGRVFGIQNMLINSAFTLPVVLFGGLA
ncbi:MAG: MFS transporter, partial [bacterium]